MKAIHLLTRTGGAELTPEEEAQLSRELADAYHMDEVSATSREVQRIAEKVRARMDNPLAQDSDTDRRHPNLPRHGPGFLKAVPYYRLDHGSVRENRGRTP